MTVSTRNHAGRWSSFAVDTPAPTAAARRRRRRRRRPGYQGLRRYLWRMKIPNPRNLAAGNGPGPLPAATSPLPPGPPTALRRGRRSPALSGSPRLPHRLPAPHLGPAGPRPRRDRVEDLAVQNMVRDRLFAKAISDCGWGTFRRMLEYKAAQAGRHLIVITAGTRAARRARPAAPAHGAQADHPGVAVPVLRYPARPGHQRGEVHLGGRSCRRHRRCQSCGADVRHSGSSRVRSAVKQEPQPAKAESPSLKARSSQPLTPSPRPPSRTGSAEPAACFRPNSAMNPFSLSRARAVSLI